MAIEIKNLLDIDAIMESRARETMDAASKEILKEFLKYVVEYVYDYDSHAEESGSFAKSWEWSEIKKSSKSLVMEMFSDPMKMGAPDPRAEYPYRHTTFMTVGWHDDARPFLAETFDGTKFKNWIGSGNRAGGYWTKFINEQLNSGGLKKIIDKHARANGLTPSGFGIG